MSAHWYFWIGWATGVGGSAIGYGLYTLSLWRARRARQ